MPAMKMILHWTLRGWVAVTETGQAHLTGHDRDVNRYKVLRDMMEAYQGQAVELASQDR